MRFPLIVTALLGVAFGQDFLPPSPPKNILQVAQERGFTAFIDLINRAGLTNDVITFTDATFLMPSNAAVQSAQPIIRGLTPAHLKGIVLGHIIPDIVSRHPRNQKLPTGNSDYTRSLTLQFRAVAPNRILTTTVTPDETLFSGSRVNGMSSFFDKGLLIPLDRLILAPVISPVQTYSYIGGPSAASTPIPIPSSTIIIIPASSTEGPSMPVVSSASILSSTAVITPSVVVTPSSSVDAMTPSASVGTITPSSSVGAMTPSSPSVTSSDLPTRSSVVITSSTFFSSPSPPAIHSSSITLGSSTRSSSSSTMTTTRASMTTGAASIGPIVLVDPTKTASSTAKITASSRLSSTPVPDISNSAPSQLTGLVSSLFAGAFVHLLVHL